VTAQLSHTWLSIASPARRHWLAIGAAVVFVTASCAKQEVVAIYPVSGRVLQHGTPVAKAMVVFHDKRPTEDVHKLPIPRATTDADGTFHLSSYTHNDGAPAGEYLVTVILNASTALPSEPVASEASSKTGDGIADQVSVDPESTPAPRNLLQNKYADPETSGLEAIVAESNNDLPPFEIN
jgi:hypothetical protein